jgi:hypothetical protein
MPDDGLQRTLRPRIQATRPPRSILWLEFVGVAAAFLALSVVAGLPAVTGSVAPALVTAAAMFAYPFLEAVGLPSLRPQIVAFVLVSSFAVGIIRFSRHSE